MEGLSGETELPSPGVVWPGGCRSYQVSPRYRELHGTLEALLKAMYVLLMKMDSSCCATICAPLIRLFQHVALSPV